MLVAGVVGLDPGGERLSRSPRRSSASCSGGMLEENFITSMIKADGNLLAFFARPVAATLGVLTLAAWFLPPVIRRLRRIAGA